MPTKMEYSTPKESMWNRHCNDTNLCTTDAISCQIQGEIPSWLEGVLYRTGPGVAQFGDDLYKHAFDPSAIIHSFEVLDGKVKYRNRVLESDVFKANMKAQRITMMEFGTAATPDPCQSLLGKFMTRFTKIPDILDATDNGAVNVFFQGDQLFASTETNKIRRIDTRTLETLGNATKHSDYLAVHNNTAHPHEDVDGTLYNMGNGMSMGKTSYKIIKFPPPTKEKSSHEQASVIVSLDSRSFNPSYYHSFSMTKRYFVFLEQPMTLNNMTALFSGATNSSPVDFFDYDPSGEVHIHVFDRLSGEKHPVLFVARAFVCYHHINAYEDEGHIVMDLCVSDGSLYKQNYLEPLSRGEAELPFAEPIRFVLPMTSGPMKTVINCVTLPNTACRAFWESPDRIRVQEEPLNTNRPLEGMEMPRINYAFNGRKYNFFYTVTIDSSYGNMTGLLKVNAVTKQVISHYTEPNSFFSEPVFAARPDSSEEDDGVILSLLLKAGRPNYASLLILDAKTFTLLARAEVETKGAVTPTLHGTWRHNSTGKAVFK